MLVVSNQEAFGADDPMPAKLSDEDGTGESASLDITRSAGTLFREEGLPHLTALSNAA